MNAEEMNGGLNTLCIPCLHVELYIYRKSKSKNILKLGIGSEERYLFKMLRDSCKDL